MKPEITDDGLQIQTFSEIYDEVAQGFKDIYGSDIDLDPESPDGQRVGIYAGLIHDLQSFGLEIGNSFDPDLAGRAAFARLMKFSGTALRPPTRSQVDVEITTDRNLTLEAGYTVDDESGNAWELDEDTNVTTGTTTVTLFAKDFGPIEAPANTVNDPATIVLGVTGVTNPNPATIGEDEETLPEARARRARSVRAPAYSTSGSLFARLGNLSDVTDLQVYENDTGSTDSRGIPAHSLWAVVEGGSVSDIIETIVKNKTGGTGLKGAIEEQYVETRELPDGTTFDVPRTARFDRPTTSEVEIQLDVTPKESGDSINTAAIKESLASLEFRINENIVVTDLYSTIYEDNGNFIAVNLEARRKGDSTWIQTRLESDPDEIFDINTADITITEI